MKPGFALRVVVALALAIGIALPASGQLPSPVSTVPKGADRIGDIVASLEKLSESDLKKFYVRCSHAALRGRMGSGEIALCSTGYEILLKRVFRGDFRALLEWSRRNRQRAGEGPDGDPL